MFITCCNNKSFTLNFKKVELYFLEYFCLILISGLGKSLVNGLNLNPLPP